MFSWLGSTAVAVVSTTTEVVSAAADYLTSVLIQDDPPNWLDILKEWGTAVVEAIKLLQKEGLGALKPIELLLNFAGDVDQKLDAWFYRVLEEPNVAVKFITYVYVFMVTVAIFILILKVSSYILNMTAKTLEGYSPEDIMAGRSGIVPPQLYMFKNMPIAFLVVVLSPAAFTALWGIMHHMLAGFVKTIYGGTTIGEASFEIIKKLLSPWTIWQMFSTAPIFAIAFFSFTIIYVLLNFIVFFLWAWMIWRVTKYGDGDKGIEVVTDTAGLAIKATITLGVLKLLVWISPIVVDLFSTGVNLTYVITGWLIFLAGFPILVMVAMPIVEGWLSDAAKNLTLHHVIHEQSYTPATERGKQALSGAKQKMESSIRTVTTIAARFM